MGDLSLITEIKFQLCAKTIHSDFLPFVPPWQHHFVFLHFGKYQRFVSQSPHD